MVQLQRYLKRTNASQGDRHLPLLNSLFIERFSQFNPYTADNSFKQYMKWARRSPQLMGFLNIIATDILSDEIKFEALEKNTSGRNKILKAEAFWHSNSGVEIAEETLYDLLIHGIGYNWMGKLDDIQMKEFCDTIVRELYEGKELKELEFKSLQLVEALKNKNSDKIAKKLRHVAASTVSMHTNEYEVLKYIQRVGVNTRTFDPDEIIVFKLMPLDGKVWPFPPMEALLSEIYLLWLISQNYVSFFENGGKPDNVFILPKELAGSKNHKYLIDTLTKYKKIQNKHGNLVFTGDLTIEQLMEIEHQMEHKDLSLYLVGVLAQFYGVPVSRIPFLVGKSATGGDAGGLADSGYWRKISVWQSKIENGYNNGLWIPYFKVKMKFSRGYLQDEVRETQTDMQKTSIAEQRLRLGIWTIEEAGRFLGVDEEEVRKAQEQMKQRQEDELKSSMMLQNNEANSKVIPNPDNQKKRDKKRQTQNKNQQDAGGKKINP